MYTVRAGIFIVFPNLRSRSRMYRRRPFPTSPKPFGGARPKVIFFFFSHFSSLFLILLLSFFPFLPIFFPFHFSLLIPFFSFSLFSSFLSFYSFFLFSLFFSFSLPFFPFSFLLSRLLSPLSLFP